MSAKVVYYPAPARAFNKEELRAIFAKFSPGDPVIQAFRQILVERLVEATVDSTEPHLTERTAGIVAGRTQEILSLQNELAEMHATIITP
jgi:hypothetical protein